MSLLKQHHILVYVSTFSLKQTAGICNISAIMFTQENGIFDEFTVNVDAKSCKKAGLDIDKSTLQYWLSQPEEVRDFLSEGQCDLHNALDKFEEWCGQYNKRIFWAHGAAFHYGILKNAMDVCGMDTPWTHYNALDAVTLFKLVDDQRVTESEKNSTPLVRANLMASKIITALGE